MHGQDIGHANDTTQYSEAVSSNGRLELSGCFNIQSKFQMSVFKVRKFLAFAKSLVQLSSLLGERVDASETKGDSILITDGLHGENT